MAQQSTNRPEKKFGPFPGGVGIAVWSNEIGTDQGTKKIRSISINPRRYFDNRSGQWKDSRSFRPEDLPALIFGLQQALEYIFLNPLAGQQESDHGPDRQDDDVPY